MHIILVIIVILAAVNGPAYAAKCNRSFNSDKSEEVVHSERFLDADVHRGTYDLALLHMKHLRKTARGLRELIIVKLVVEAIPKIHPKDKGGRDWSILMANLKEAVNQRIEGLPSGRRTEHMMEFNEDDLGGYLSIVDEDIAKILSFANTTIEYLVSMASELRIKSEPHVQNYSFRGSVVRMTLTQLVSDILLNDLKIVTDINGLWEAKLIDEYRSRYTFEPLFSNSFGYIRDLNQTYRDNVRRIPLPAHGSVDPN